MMGTYIEVTSPYSQAPQIVFKEIKRIESLLSKYDPDSEISILNRNGMLKVSPETFEVISQAKDFYRFSAGAFDITVGPLMELWGFVDKDFRVPDQSEITRVMEVVGSDKIILRQEDNVVEFTLPGVEIDLGAIAKGYCLDQAVKKLKEAGIDSCMINAGGQVFCLGDKFGHPWRVGVWDPQKKIILGDLGLTDRCVSTSGDYQQYFIEAGKRYSHIIDPRTGYPATSGVISATVIADDALTADALSTAAFVLGAKDARSMVREIFPSVEIRFIEEEGIEAKI